MNQAHLFIEVSDL